MVGFYSVELVFILIKIWDFFRQRCWNDRIGEIIGIYFLLLLNIY